MRYVIEFLIPGAIVVIVALLLFRNRAHAPAHPAAQPPDTTGTLSTGTFVLILIVGAIFTVALVYALHTHSP